MKPKRWNAYHYNAVAKEIRQGLEKSLSFHNAWSSLKGYDNKGQYYATEALVVLAINFAKRFKEDSDKADTGIVFDHLSWLDKCSPNPDLYPLSELWEDD